MDAAVAAQANDPVTSLAGPEPLLAIISSPTQSVWHVLGIPIRAYSICIVLGIVAAAVVTEIRMRRRGAPPGLVLDIVIWAVPFGIVGARVYHVATTFGDYFGEGGRPLDVFRIWEGGIGIWGAVTGEALGAYIACRRLGIPLRFLADALAPGLPLAQAIGRWGNYFNNELYGGQTDLPWGLRIYRFDLIAGEAVTNPGTGEPIVSGIYHPTFLYESVWNLGVALLVWQLDRRHRFGRGRAFALYVAAYCVGRFWIEALRTDRAHVILGLRLNCWTALLVLAGALAYFLLVRGPQERLVVAEDGTLTPVPVTATDDATYPDAAATGKHTATSGSTVGGDAGVVSEPDNTTESPPTGETGPGDTTRSTFKG